TGTTGTSSSPSTVHDRVPEPGTATGCTSIVSSLNYVMDKAVGGSWRRGVPAKLRLRAAAGGHGPALLAAGALGGAVTGSGWPARGVMAGRERRGLRLAAGTGGGRARPWA